MKGPLRIAMVSALLLALSVVAIVHYASDGVSSADERAAARAERATFAQAALELEFLKTVDPALGIIPAERLFVARQIASELKASKRNSSTPGVTTDWAERGPSNVGGRTRTLMFDPNDTTKRTVWAGSASGGLWKNTDSGNRSQPWVLVDDRWNNLAVTTIAFDPNNTTDFYVGTGEGYNNIDAVRGGGIFKSKDGGQNWIQLPSTFNRADPLNAIRTFSHIQKIVVHPDSSHIFAATVSGGVQRCTSPCEARGGGVWRPVLGGRAASDIEIGADGTIYAAVGLWRNSNIFRSTDRGLTWDSVGVRVGGGMPPNSRRIELAVAPSDENIVYALVAHRVPEGTDFVTRVEGLYRSDNKGNSWTRLASPEDSDAGIPDDDFSRGQAWYDLALAVDPNNSHHVITGAVDLFKSKDGGGSWDQISLWTSSRFAFLDPPIVHADHHAITFQPGSSDIVVFGHDGGFSFVVDATEDQPTFFEHNKGYNVTQFYSVALSPDAGSNVMLGGAQDNGTQRFDTRGIDATSQVKGGDGGFSFIDQDDSHVAIASYVNNTFARSTDSGQSFGEDLISDRSSGRFINPADYDDREDILFTARGPTSIYRVRNVVEDPSDAEEVNLGLGAMASHIRVSPFASEGTSTLFVGTEGGRVYKVENAHATPTLTEITPDTAGYRIGGRFVSSIDVGEDEKQLLLTVSNYGVRSVWESRDGGSSWSSKDQSLPDMPVRWGMYNPNERKEVLIATDAGVWETYDIGAANPTWVPSETLPMVRVDMLQYRAADDLVVAATHGRGMWTARMRSSVGDVDVALVIDRSESMDSLNYIGPAKTAAKSFLGLMRLDDYAAVTSFSSSVTVEHPLQKLATEAGRSAAQAAVDGITTGGFTTLGGGMQRGLTELNKGRIENVQAMILLTDGKENQPPYVADVLPAVPDSLTVHTIGLGPDADQILLQLIATETGGSYNFAPSPATLQQVYDDIRMQIDGTTPIARIAEVLAVGEAQTAGVTLDNSVSDARFKFFWSGETPSISVTDPSRTVMKSGESSPGVSWTIGQDYAVVEVKNPEAGSWQIEVEANAESLTSTPYMISVSGKSPITLVPLLPGAIEEGAAGPAESAPVRIAARLLADGYALSAPVVTADVLVPTSNPRANGRLYADADGVVDITGSEQYRTVKLRLFDDGEHEDGVAGDGVFAALLPIAGVAGSYSVELSASDSGSGNMRISRRAGAAFVLTSTAPDAEEADVIDDSDTVLALGQNYPNPVNRITEMRFSVPTGAWATLTLYSIDGRRVAVIYDGEPDPEEELIVSFDATALAPGVYPYVLDAAGKRLTRRLVVQR